MPLKYSLAKYYFTPLEKVDSSTFRNVLFNKKVNFYNVIFIKNERFKDKLVNVKWCKN